MDVSVYEELERMEAIAAEQHVIVTKDPKEMSEQELRRQRLLDAEREMARRKENSRQELEARRMKRGEKRQHSPDIGQNDPSVVELSDESVRMTGGTGNQSDEASSQKSNRSRLSDEEMRELGREQSPEASSDSSDSSSDDDDDDDDDDSNDSDKDSNNDDSNDNSDYNNPSPISVDQLAKSDRSDGDSPGHVDTNGAAKVNDLADPKKEIDEHIDLPPYFPAIQGKSHLFL